MRSVVLSLLVCLLAVAPRTAWGLSCGQMKSFVTTARGRGLAVYAEAVRVVPAVRPDNMIPEVVEFKVLEVLLGELPSPTIRVDTQGIHGMENGYPPKHVKPGTRWLLALRHGPEQYSSAGGCENPMLPVVDGKVQGVVEGDDVAPRPARSWSVADVAAALTAPAPAPTPKTDPWRLVTLSESGAEALVTLDSPTASTRQLRALEVATGKVLAEASLPEVSGADRFMGFGRRRATGLSPEQIKELEKAGEVLARFPTGFNQEFAATEDGKTVAASVAAKLYVVRSGKASKVELDGEAYLPAFAPGGKQLFFKVARGDGAQSRMDLWTMPADGSQKPRAVVGGEGLLSPLMVGHGGRLLAIATGPKSDGPICLVSFDPEGRAGGKVGACLEPGRYYVDSYFSPRRTWVVIATGQKGAGPQHTFRWSFLRTQDAKVVREVPYTDSALGISDTGRFVHTSVSGPAVVLDVATGAEQKLPEGGPKLLSGRYRGASEVVDCEGDGCRILEVGTGR